MGVALKVSDQLGYSDQFGTYTNNPGGNGEQDFEQDLLATVRVFERGQVGLTVPFVQTNRYTQSLTDFGGGLGDIALTGRWDFLLANESAHLPGIAVLGGLTFPTGSAADQSTSILGASATGLGAYQAALGLALERTFFDKLVVNATGLVTENSVRQVGATTEQLGLLFTGLLAVGWIFPNEAALAATFTFSDGLDNSINQQPGQATCTAPIASLISGPSCRAFGSARRVNSFGLAGGLPITDEWRLQATAFVDVPELSRNHIDGLGTSFTLIRAFL